MTQRENLDKKTVCPEQTIADTHVRKVEGTNTIKRGATDRENDHLLGACVQPAHGFNNVPLGWQFPVPALFCQHEVVTTLNTSPSQLLESSDGSVYVIDATIELA